MNEFHTHKIAEWEGGFGHGILSSQKLFHYTACTLFIILVGMCDHTLLLTNTTVPRLPIWLEFSNARNIFNQLSLTYNVNI